MLGNGHVRFGGRGWRNRRSRDRTALHLRPQLLRLDADQAQLLFILLAHRYTRGGLIITSNLEFADWTSVFNDDARLTAALLDRLTHRCHLLHFRGDSYRFRESLAARELSADPGRPRTRRTATPPVATTEEVVLQKA